MTDKAPIPDGTLDANSRDVDGALGRLQFCMDRLRDADYLAEGIDWDTEIVPGCTVEKLVEAVAKGEAVLRVAD